MGSITSRPKAPPVTQQQNVVYTQSPAPQESVTPIEPSPEEISKTRVENILRRSRSTLGTVFTSFRGILSNNNSLPQRKSLLGE